MLGALVVLLLAASLLLFSPRIQSRILRKLTDSVSEKFGTTLTFERIRIVPFNTAIVTNACIVDNEPYTADEYGKGWARVDTLGCIRNLKATFTLRSLLSDHGIEISRVEIQGGEFNLVSEPDSIYKTNLARIFGLVPKEKLPDQAPSLFRLKRVKIRDFRYSMKNFRDTPHSYGGIGINWEDLDLICNVDVHNMVFSDLIMSGIVDHVDAREKSGYHLIHCSGEAMVGRGCTSVRNLKIRDSLSRIDMPVFKMNYRNSRVFRSFLEDVSLEGRFEPSTLSLGTITAFSGALDGNPSVFEIKSGALLGPVHRFLVHDFEVSEKTTGLKGRIDGRVSGLPDISSAEFDIRGSEWSLSTSQISRVIANFSGGKGPDISGIARGIRFLGGFSAKGSIDNITAGVNLSSAAGSAKANATIRNLFDGSKTATVEGNAGTSSLDLGRILGNSTFGKVDADLSASAELIPGNLRVTLDSLHARNFSILGRDFHNIYAKGGYGKMGPFGTVIINDSNVKMVASGERKQYTASVPEINLGALGIDKRGSSLASFDAGVTLTENSIGLGLYGIRLTDESGTRNIGNLKADAVRDGLAETIILNSSFADARASFKSGVQSFLKDIQYATTRRDLYALYTDIPENRAPADCNISIDFHDSRELLSFLKPEIYVADGTRLDLSMSQGRMKGSINSSRVAYNDLYLKDMMLSADNADGRLRLGIDASDLHVPGVSFGQSVLTATADDNNVGINLTYGNESNKDNNGTINLSGSLARIQNDTLSVSAHIDSSKINLAGKEWALAPADINYRSGRLFVDGFALNSGNQSISAAGGILSQGKERFAVDLSNIELGIVNEFFDIPADLGGKVSGHALLISPVKDRLQLAMNVHSDSLFVDSHNAGAVRIGSAWDDEHQVLNCILQNTSEGSKVLSASASYAPSDKYVRGWADLDSLDISTAAPFLSDIFSEMGGNISGRIECKGRLDSLSVESRGTRFSNVLLKMAFTGVPYTIDGDFSVSRGGVEFKHLSVKDDMLGSGTLSGHIRNFLKKPLLDASLSMTRLKLLDMDEYSAEGFYGNLAASGSVNVKGPFDNLNIEGTLSTTGAGDIHIPLNSALTQSRQELLTFTAPVPERDPYEELRIQQTSARKAKSNLSAKARINISPDVIAYAEIEKSSGNLVSAFGNGILDLEYNSERDLFQINGDYEINGGSYRFAIPGIIGKDLSITNGSSVKFGGDLMDSQLDINAVYSLKTSIAPLTSDTTSVSTRRLVNCGLTISDRIRNPQVDFSIDVPDLDPVTTAEVQTAFNTQDKLQKQFVSLLLLNSFLPSENSGIVNSRSNMLYANVTEMMSGQVNNLLQKLEIPVDLGFGYQANDAGTDIFDVAVSTQLFNNRVIVGGSVGNRKYSTTTSANGDVVGDLDIEVKIDRSGKLRFKLFSHSADEFTSFLDYSQRNGIGVTYQKEFGSKDRNDTDSGEEETKTIVIQ